MAGPKTHAGPTVVLMAASAFVCTPMALVSKNSLVLFLVLFFGVLFDFVDHFSVRRIRKLAKGDVEPVENWICWMHTWWAALGVLAISLAVWNVLPFLSYAVHILIDAARKEIEEYKDGPLPASLSRFIPPWLRYSVKGGEPLKFLIPIARYFSKTLSFLGRR